MVRTSAVFAAVTEAVQALPDAARQAVGCVQVTGQMHGVMLWDAADMAADTLCYTWQYRCAQPAGAAFEKSEESGIVGLRSTRLAFVTGMAQPSESHPRSDRRPQTPQPTPLHPLSASPVDAWTSRPTPRSLRP